MREDKGKIILDLQDKTIEADFAVFSTGFFFFLINLKSLFCFIYSHKNLLFFSLINPF